MILEAMCHFVAICEFKLESSSGNAQIRDKSSNFRPVSVSLKFDRWPRNTIEHLFHTPRSYVCQFITIYDFKLELSSRTAQISAKSPIFRPYDLVIWRMTSEQNRAPLKLCHDDVIKWKHFPRCWSFVRGIHPSPVNSSHKGHWRGALMFLWFAPE